MKDFLLNLLNKVSEKLGDDKKKIILIVSAGLFGLLVLLNIVLGLAGVNVPARVDGIGEIIKIISGVIAIIAAKVSK